MALTADNGGRITTQPRTPSGSSMPPELARLIAQATSGGGSGGGASGRPLRINLRSGPATREVRTEGIGWRSVDTGNARQFSTLEEAVNSFYLMDDDYRESLVKKMWYYGLVDGPNNITQALGAWGKAVELAWNFRQAGKDVNPVDMFARMTNLRAGQLGAGGGGGGAPRTTRQRQFNTLDPEEAKVFIRQAYQEAMGRDPHDAEVRQLISSLQKGFRSNPSIQETTVDGMGNTTQRVIDPGFDPQSFVANTMDNDPESAAYQAASIYYPALQAALASPV